MQQVTVPGKQRIGRLVSLVPAACLIGVCLVLPAAPLTAQQLPAGQHPQALDTVLRRPIHLDYLLYLPRGCGRDDTRWPLILFLHGGLGRGDDLARVMWYPIPAHLAEDDSFPFIVVTPQCPEGRMWTDPEALGALLDEVIARYPVDPDRVYLVGYSMGGHGAWFTAYTCPERFAAMAVMSGQGNPWFASRLAQVPVWIFHGARDGTIPVSESRRMADALWQEGGEVRLTIRPEQVHRPPTWAEHEELFAWFLTRSLAAREGGPSRIERGAILQAVPAEIDPAASYLFYLHGRIVSADDTRPEHEQFGIYAYDEIVTALADSGFTVISEARPAGTEVAACARTVAGGIERLLEAGVPPERVTVVGASMGGVIAYHVSAFLQRAGVRYVLLASCSEDLRSNTIGQGYLLWGDVLSIRDATDELSSSCRPFADASPHLGRFEEIVLDLGLGHGLLYRPLPAWLAPTVRWARTVTIEER